MAEVNPSGQKGLLGKIADAWDRIPVKGVMAGMVAALGAVLVFASGGHTGTCEKNPLRGVYRPQRLQIVEKCSSVTGTVKGWRHEHDGDYHVAMEMDTPGWTNSVNDKRQKGFTVVEFVPGDKRPDFKVGQKLKLLGTKVLDKQHGGWIELHPVFSYEEVPLPTAPKPGVNKPPAPTEGE